MTTISKKEKEVLRKLAIELAAVSYTHLDVYKRQLPYSSELVLIDPINNQIMGNITTNI